MKSIDDLFTFLRPSTIIEHRELWAHSLITENDTIINYDKDNGIISYAKRDHNGEEYVEESSHDDTLKDDMKLILVDVQKELNYIRYSSVKLGVKSRV